MRLRLYIPVFLLLTVCVSVLADDDIKDLQKQQKKLEQQLQQTSEMLSQTKKDEKATVTKLNLLNQDIKTRKKLIKNINKEISVLDTDIRNLNTQQKQNSNEIARLKQDYARLVRQTHYADLHASPLLFLCSSDNFQQLVRRIRYMKRFADYRKQQVARIEDLQTQIVIQSNLLNSRRMERSSALQSQKREQDKLNRDERKQRTMLGDLKKKEKELIAQQKKQQKKADELQRKIDQLIQQQAKSDLTKEQKLIAGGFEANKSRLPWPVEKGFISGYFGTHQHPVYEHVTVNNKGIYIQTPADSYARTVFDGEVTSCILLGNTYAVIVQHGNYRTVYSNLKKLLVKQGDQLKTKQNIGIIASDPAQDNKTELFFQIYKDRTLLNPSLWIAK
ncbi:MAG: peptidoglycan DD-metalloendopeptidase family protein [Paludibacteraceae bacterium]|nr:peptidoglycan DD-metalloendopeptidase family protein [Paludibacteraceae bacterium]